MSATYYAQGACRPDTLTVGELIERLSAFGPTAPVIFRSPQNGCFGPNTTYSVDTALFERLEREEVETPGGQHFDEETGEWSTYEAWTDVLHAWEGVVIA